MATTSDVIQYPEEKPRLTLSVSDNPIQLTAGLEVPYDFYVEEFVLHTNLTASGNNSTSNRVGIFTHRLSILGSEVLSLGVPGYDGSSVGVPNGGQGGTLEFYAEDIPSSTVKKLHLNTQGGSGYSPGSTDEQGEKKSIDGGNGGGGGQVNIFYCNSPIRLTQCVEGLLVKLADNTNQWPSGFASDLRTLTRLITKYKNGSMFQKWKGFISSDLEKDAFQEGMRHIHSTLTLPDNGVHSDLTQTVNVRGGTYGVGYQGGKNGSEGKIGSFTVTSTLDPSILKTTTCFVHPTQCRMLLEKARRYYFSGTDIGKARSANICQQLQHRLQFLEYEPSLSGTPLGEAYRKAEGRLFIPSGPRGEEPASIKMLRNVTAEATAMLNRIYLGMGIYNHGQGYVPRCSFQSYKKGAEEQLNHLQQLERVDQEISSTTLDANRKASTIREGVNKCVSGISLQTSLSNEAERELEALEIEIAQADQLTESARKALFSAVEMSGIDLDSHFGVPFHDVVSAIGQVVMTDGNPAMIMSEGAGLADTGFNYLERDDGTKVKKKYIIRKLHKIESKIKDLIESSQSLRLADPDCEKLVLSGSELDDLLGDFSAILGDDSIDSINSKFNTYKDAVLRRNKAILLYNEQLISLQKYAAQIQTLKSEQKILIGSDFALIGVGNPVVKSFLDRLYVDGIEGLQECLYRTQRAYNFVALNDDNIIGRTLQGLRGSRLDATILEQIHSEICRSYNDWKERMGNSPQSFTDVRYILKKQDLQPLEESGENAKVLRVTIPTDTHCFGGMANVRLTKVRFFLDGVTATDQYLTSMVTHTGQETMVNTQGKTFTFTHQPVLRRLKYNLSTKQYTERGAIDGDMVTALEIGDYALVGPFTTWKIEIYPEDNPGLDLSKVKSACLSFDGKFLGQCKN